MEATSAGTGRDKSPRITSKKRHTLNPTPQASF